ncbi:MAG: cytoplasmic protein [Desulfatitalea sp.]|nr:cytoplasmic protein [Desulfatitalea sp.]NNK00761.1 cytoplasmic protein [Desulfatitalea sp.]
MSQHTHQFVETYQGLVGFGMDRKTDEDTVICYLQKFSDDTLMSVLRDRLADDDLAALFGLLSDLLRRHLNEDEYHKLFLKEDHPH